jgi:threonine aldolase
MALGRGEAQLFARGADGTRSRSSSIVRHARTNNNSHIELRSDNAAGVAPEIIAAISGANTGSALAYGDDDWTARLRDKVREVFEHPQAEVFPVISGTAANSIALAALCPPWGSVLCHDTAHILRSECGATSMFGGGAIMRGVGGDGFRVSADELREAFEERWGDPHHWQSVLSLTEPSDHGTCTPSTGHRVGCHRRRARSRAHLDGHASPTFAALGCGPADLTWRRHHRVLPRRRRTAC